MRITLAVLALGMLGVSGCAPERVGTNCTTCATGSPMPASKADAFVVADPRLSGSPYGNRLPAPNPSQFGTTSATVTVAPPVPTAVPPASTTSSVRNEPRPPDPASAPSSPSAPSLPPTLTNPPARSSLPPTLEPEPPTRLPVEIPPALPPTPSAEPAPAPTEPAKLPERPFEPLPQRPSIPEGPAEVRDLSETPEPERLLPGTPAPARPMPIPPAPVEPPIKPVVAVEPAPPASPDALQVLTGTVECWRKTFRLRYAGVDVEDANGGRVTLIGGAAVDELREGQKIRVSGTLIPAADRASAPTLQVHMLEVVD